MSDSPTVHIVLSLGRDFMVSKPIALYQPQLDYTVHFALPMECPAATCEDMPILRKMVFRFMGQTMVIDNQECLIYEFDSRCLC